MCCTRMRAKSREAALFSSSFLLPSHAEAEGLGIGLRCHGVFFVRSCERPTSQLRGKTGLASLNRFRPTSVGSQQGLCAPYPNATGIFRPWRSLRDMGDVKGQDRMGETADVYVADDLYDAEDDTNGIRVGASPAHGAASPPAVGQMQVDDSSRGVLSTGPGAVFVCLFCMLP